MKNAVYGIAVALMAMSASAQQPDTSARNSGSVIVRADTPFRLYPDANRQPLTIVPAGTSVTVIRQEGEWTNVSFRDRGAGERFGYVPTSSLIVPASSGSSTTAET